MLALAAVPAGIAADPSRPHGASGPKDLDDKSSPSGQFLTAYNSMSLADWLSEKGMRAEAADLYAEALNLFDKLAADYPQWQPTVVSFRVNYCRDALRNLQKTDGGQTTDARHQTPDRKKMADKGQTPEGGLPSGLSAKAPTSWRIEAKTGNQPARQSLGDGVTPEDEKSGIKNPQSEIGNLPAEARNVTTAKVGQQPEINYLSPLNSKLQQAVFRERGRDYTGALSMYIAILEEFPREPWALKGACRCCLRLGHMDKARALAGQALTLPLPDAELNLLAALVDCNDGRYQVAIPLLHQSLKQNGACPEAHIALGVALTAIGEMKEAQEEMKRALSLNPKLGDAYYNLARLSLRQKPADEKNRAYYQLAMDTARVHYQNAMRQGAAPDPELEKLLAE